MGLQPIPFSRSGTCPSHCKYWSYGKYQNQRFGHYNLDYNQSPTYHTCSLLITMVVDKDLDHGKTRIQKKHSF